ncbi:MAG: hypothetical protein LBH04_08370 [Tannerellaceae bacterium]|jgi:hypothetical protein|nr:hypothetical protein [Tannerellaceae bacterium]
MKDIANNIISYEGLRRVDDDYKKPSLAGKSPVALGEVPKWSKGNPPESMFSVYSSSPMELFGAIIKKTNV